MAKTNRPLDDLMDARTQQLFTLVVEHYIDAGTPVGSKTLANHKAVQVSSATVRNIMADLESMGLVRSPHTSAGKVPTAQGLRFFVDSLLAVDPLDDARVQEFERQLNPDMSPAELVRSASNLLSHITHLTCMVTTPRRHHVMLRHVEFLKMSGDRVLVILVLNDREVQNRVIHTARDYTEAELTQAANYLNREYGGRSLMAIRNAVLDSMQADKDRMDAMMQTALDMANRTFADVEEESGSELVLSGERNLLNVSEDTDQIRSLFETFSRKGSILHLLDRCLDSEGIQLFIGTESGYSLMEDVSLVTAPYEVNGKVAGVLGVVGPSRMAYREVIPVVDVTARVLGAAMRSL